MRAVIVLAALASMLFVTAPAANAAPSCGRQVIDDWYDDGRIDGSYALHCYDDAIEILPRDVRDYSSAKEDIQRALQAKLRGDEPPAAETDPSPQDPATTETTETTSTPPSQGGDLPTDTVANPPLADSDSASSIPLPLLILAGLALLLIAGGSAGYLIRRFQNRQLPPPTG